MMITKHDHKRDDRWRDKTTPIMKGTDAPKGTIHAAAALDPHMWARPRRSDRLAGFRSPAMRHSKTLKMPAIDGPIMAAQGAGPSGGFNKPIYRQSWRRLPGAEVSLCFSHEPITISKARLA